MPTIKKTPELQEEICKICHEYLSLYRIFGDDIIKDYPKITQTYIYDVLLVKLGLSIYRIKRIIHHIRYLCLTCKDAITNMNIHEFMLSNLEINPYNFIVQTECLITFKQAETIASILNLDISLDIRCQKYMYDIILNKQKSLYIPLHIMKEHLIKYCLPTTKNDSVKYVDSIINIQCSFHKFNDRQFVTLPFYEVLEKNASNQMIELYTHAENVEKDVQEQIVNFIREYEITNNITINSKQKEAIIKCICNKFHVICGYPGTGKSTIIDVINSYFMKNDPDMKISYSAPTGLALNNILSKVSYYNKMICGTNHRLLYTIFPLMNKLHELNFIDTNDLLWRYSRKDDKNISWTTKDQYLYNLHTLNNNIPNILIIDEFSMVNMFVMKDILDFCQKFDCRLIIIGDPNQLPPISHGNPLHKITNCDIFNDKYVTYLEDVMRQDNSKMITNIKKIIDDRSFLTDMDFSDNNMVFMNYNEFLNKKYQIEKQKLNDFIINNNITIDNTQFITPQESKECGYTNINYLLQEIFNANNPKIRNTNYKIGDPIIRTINSYSMCEDGSTYLYANGDIGHILSTTRDKVKITYENHDSQHNEQLISVKELNNEFQLRYCISIHKAQGNQYKKIVLFIGTPHEFMWTNETQNPKSLLYTAISRAQERCFVIGNKMYLQLSQIHDQFNTPSLFLS